MFSYLLRKFICVKVNISVLVLKCHVHVFMYNISNKHDVFSKFLFPIDNISSLIENISLRGDLRSEKQIEKLKNLQKQTHRIEFETDSINELLFSLPNDIHPVIKQSNSSRLIQVAGEKKESNELLHCYDILREKDLLRTKDLTRYCGERSYYLIGSLAKLECGLVEFSLKEVIKRNFKLISVPDILSSKIINGCGMTVDGERSQVIKSQ